jgi:hypothetical protein
MSINPDRDGLSIGCTVFLSLLIILCFCGYWVYHQFTFEGNKRQWMSFAIYGDPWNSGTGTWEAEIGIYTGIGNLVYSSERVVNVVYGVGERFDRESNSNINYYSLKHPAQPDDQLEEFETSLESLNLKPENWIATRYIGMDEFTSEDVILLDKMFSSIIDAGWIPKRIWASYKGSKSTPDGMCFEGYTHDNDVIASETFVYGLLKKGFPENISDVSFVAGESELILFSAYFNSNSPKDSQLEIIPYRVNTNIKDQEFSWNERDLVWKKRGYIQTTDGVSRGNHDLFRQHLIDMGWKLVSDPSVDISEYAERNEDHELQINPIRRQVERGIWTFRK